MDCIQVLTRTQRRESEIILDAELRVHGDGMNGREFTSPRFPLHLIGPRMCIRLCVCMYLRIGKSV